MSYLAVTAREHVLAGPHFHPEPGMGNCVCGLVDQLDDFTGLCRECWRHWRWAAKREEGKPGAPAPTPRSDP